MKHHPKQILFIIHRLYFNGTAKKGGIDRIVEFLRETNNVTLIEHPFEQINHTSEFTNKDIQYHHKARSYGPLLWIEELLINVSWIFRAKKKYDLAIASDPLNFFSCYVLKRFGKVKKTQFHSTDYSNPRFNNPLLELVYQNLYHFAVSHADLVTVVSKRMKNNAQQISRRNHPYLLPNSPEFDVIPKLPYEKKQKNSIVLIVGRWGNQVNTDRIVDCMKKLADREHHVTLHIIGHVDSNYRKTLEKGRKSSLVFHGAVPYEKALQIMSTCAIGITAYKATESYVHYADSLKIREYAAAGLPVVCDSIFATSQEVLEYKAGYVYQDTDEMVVSIIRLTENKSTYVAASNNALRWAKKNDKRKLLKNLYDKYHI